MGLAGPVPIADAIKRRRSQLSKSHSKDASTTRAPIVPPDRPAFLTGHARECWDYIVPLLVEQRTVARADRNILIRYCVTYQRWREIAELFAGESATQADDHGKMRKSPYFQMYRDLASLMERAEGELGLTPKARMRITPEGEPSDDEPESGLLD